MKQYLLSFSKVHCAFYPQTKIPFRKCRVCSDLRIFSFLCSVRSNATAATNANVQGSLCFTSFACLLWKDKKKQTNYILHMLIKLNKGNKDQLSDM